MKTPARKKAGAPLLNGERMKSHTIRTTDAQWEKSLRLGGQKWWRKQVDDAKEDKL